MGAIYRLVTAILLAGAWLVRPAAAQERLAFVEIGEGERIPVAHADSLETRAAAVIDSLRSAGFYFAEIDTLVRGAREATAWVSRGPRAELGELRFDGIGADRAKALQRLLDLRPGDAFSLHALEQDVERILSDYSREGRFLASVRIEEIELRDEAAFGVTLQIDEGPVLPLKRIELIGGGRTNPSLVARIADLKVGERLHRFDPATVRERLLDAGFFEAVGDPEIVVESDSGAVLRIPVEEGPPGSFDLVLGYLPPQSPEENGSIIGNGHLELRNIFGGGRTMAVRLNRLPGQASSIDVHASNPFLLGLPLGLSGSFRGLEQDSTYSKQEYGGELRYYVAAGVDLVGNFSREITGPGQAGLRLGDAGRQIIPDAEAWFLGLGVSVRRLDRAISPTRGMFVEMNLETGQKEQSERVVIGGDTTRRTNLLEQKRLRATARFFVPTFERQVVALGGDAGLLLSSEYDRSDLFRFGGATSLRGYDEDRFLGRAIGRALAEYRFLIDRLSYAYAFFDLGYVQRPVTPDLEAASAFHPGYGVGIQFQTAVGLVNVSAALNPDSGPTEARIHAGLSFGL